MLIPYIEAIRHEEDWDEVDAHLGNDFAFTMRFRDKYLASTTKATIAVIDKLKELADSLPGSDEPVVPAPIKDYYYQGR